MKEKVMSNCELLGMTNEAPVDVIKPSQVSVCDASNCETTIQLGVFFDGTGNNATKDDASRALTNIVRLHDAYIEDSARGSAKTYIKGLGTECTELDEPGESTFGGAFGSGGEGRLLLALCSTLNNIHEIIFKQKWVGPETVNAICRPSKFFRSDSRLLEKVGLSESLNGSTLPAKINFFRKKISDLKKKLSENSGAVVKEITFDIFGFSRGAAEARVFCHWLKEIAPNGKIAGIPVQFRFLGLMETVASVGVWDGAMNAIFNKTGGHSSWAISPHLLILPEVKNCIHMVAMHEIRKNFPLDQVAVGDSMPDNCFEFAYPGSHSDVGGGYAPGELGLAVGKTLEEGDSRKLSQIPLNHMFDCAKAAGAPMAKEIAVRNSVSLFEISPTVQTAFHRFIQTSPRGKQRLSDWMLPYLIWRWKTRREYSSLDHVRNAKGADLGYLMAAHAAFMEDGSRMEFYGDLEKSLGFVKDARALKHTCWTDAAYNQTEMGALDRDAWEVRHRVASARPNSAELDDFFDKFVHDSLAGFRKKLREPTGHWRYRRAFRGADQPILT